MSFFSYAWDWVTTSANWHGSGSIPQQILAQLGYSALPLLIAALIAVPAGVVIGHTGRGAVVVVNLANAWRAIPTLGLLILLAVYLGFSLLTWLLPLVVLAMFIFMFGLVTFGLGWALFWLMSPVSVVWAPFYYGITLGSPASATIGMRVMDIEMRTWYGAPAYFVLGAVHAVVYWLSVSLLTPFIVLVGFFTTRRRLLHDMLVGTVLINNPKRAAALRARAAR